MYDRGGMETLNSDVQMEGHDPFDIFDIFTGGAHRLARHARNRGEDMRVKVRASLKDLYMGKEYEFTYTRYAMCPYCRGSGTDSYENVETCDKCNGQGVYMVTKSLGPNLFNKFKRLTQNVEEEGK